MTIGDRSPDRQSVGPCFTSKETPGRRSLRVVFFRFVVVLGQVRRRVLAVSERGERRDERHEAVSEAPQFAHPTGKRLDMARPLHVPGTKCRTRADAFGAARSAGRVSAATVVKRPTSGYRGLAQSNRRTNIAGLGPLPVHPTRKLVASGEGVSVSRSPFSHASLVENDVCALRVPCEE